MMYRRPEELPAWRLARKLVNAIYSMTDEGDFARDWALRDQARRAAVSMMANISEGFCRRSDKEFVQFLFLAKASAGELQSHLYVAIDRRYISDRQFALAFEDTERFARQVSGLISYLTSGGKRSVKRP